MERNQKFFKCIKCGNIVGIVVEAGNEMLCCKEEMVELIPNTVDAAVEKHIPVVTINGDEVLVNIGEVDHPMIPEHYIEWIYLETKKGGQRKILEPNESPNAKFLLVDDKVVAVFAYCNIHGLWKKEI